MKNILTCDSFWQKYLEYFEERDELTKITISFKFNCGFGFHKHYAHYLVSICEKCKYNINLSFSEVLKDAGKCLWLALVFQTGLRCVTLQYVLNFQTNKIVFEEKEFCLFGFQIKNLIDYLRDDLLVDPFFIFNLINERVEISRTIRTIVISWWM